MAIPICSTVGLIEMARRLSVTHNFCSPWRRWLCYPCTISCAPLPAMNDLHGSSFCGDMQALGRCLRSPCPRANRQKRRLRWVWARMGDAEIALVRLGRSRSQAGFQMCRFFFCVCTQSDATWLCSRGKKISSVLHLFLCSSSAAMELDSSQEHKCCNKMQFCYATNVSV